MKVRPLSVVVGCLAVVFGLGACRDNGTSSPPAKTPSPSATATPTKAQPLADDEIFARTASGVVLVTATGCSVGGGSGFLVAPDLVLTDAHVVGGGGRIAVRSGRHVANAQVVGFSAKDDVALLRLLGDLPGDVLKLSPKRVRPGQHVVAVGYPGLQPVALTSGEVSAVDRRVSIGGEDGSAHDLHGLIQMDAPISPGDSGGPVLDTYAQVVGLTEAASTPASGQQSINFATPVAVAAAHLASWRHKTEPIDTATCDLPDAAYADVKLRTIHPDGPAIATTFDAYFTRLNEGDPAVVFENFFTPTMQQSQGGEEAWSAGVENSAFAVVSLEAVHLVSATSDTADLRFVSEQPAADAPKNIPGATCVVWNLRYTLISDNGLGQENGSWQIDGKVINLHSPRRCTTAERQAADDELSTGD